MRDHDSAIVKVGAPLPPVRSPRRTGLWWGLLGVAAFSFTVPMTRIAVEGMSPLFIGAGRAVVAAALAALALIVTRQQLPRGNQWHQLLIIGGGVVVGFPLLTSYALQSVPAAHAAVVIAVLPACTAVISVARTGERPPARFWWAAGAGALAVAATAVATSGGFTSLRWTDLLLVLAVVAAGIGYAEGGLLSRDLGAWPTISWALVLYAPAMAALTWWAWAAQPPNASPGQWAAFGYLGVVSMFLGFCAWYRGLALGPMAQVSQVQLTQPVMTLAWAAVLLHESITLATVAGGLAVIACTAGAVRSRTTARPK